MSPAMLSRLDGVPIVVDMAMHADMLSRGMKDARIGGIVVEAHRPVAILHLEWLKHREAHSLVVETIRLVMVADQEILFSVEALDHLLRMPWILSKANIAQMEDDIARLDNSVPALDHILVVIDALSLVRADQVLKLLVSATELDDVVVEEVRIRDDVEGWI